MPLKLFKRGEVWHYAGTVAGRRLRGSTGASEKAIAQRIAAEREARAWTRHLDGPGATLTFADAAIAYRKAQKSDRFLERVEDYWKDMPVRKITAGAIREAALKLYPNHSGATRNRQVIVPTQAIINFAAEMEWCSPIKVTRFPVTTRPKKHVTVDWARAFAAHASPHLGALCLFMFGTGARIGEATALTWADIDLEKRQAFIRQTKVNDDRLAHLPAEVFDAIANIPSNRDPAEAVFGYASRETVRKSWDAVIARAGIERLSPHCCRHGFATRMLQRGIDVKTVAKRGGWKDVATLLKTYAHATEGPTVTDVIFGTDLTQEKNKKQLKPSKQRRIS